MMKKLQAKEKKGAKVGVAHTAPKFPYTITPNTLRKCLASIPERQLPAKVNQETLRTWGYSNTNDHSIIRVLKAVGLLGASNEPTDVYTKFMDPKTGPAVLGKQIKEVYAKIFELVPTPTSPSDEDLKRFFNIHSGGSEDTIKYQCDTYKALISYATFGPSDALAASEAGSSTGMPQGAPGQLQQTMGGAGIHINLHIHLPENKSKSDYEAIIDRIGEAIYRSKL